MRYLLTILFLLSSFAFAEVEPVIAVSEDEPVVAPLKGERVCGVFLDKKVKNDDINSIKEAFEEKHCYEGDILFIRTQAVNMVGFAAHVCNLESMVVSLGGIVCEYRGSFRDGHFYKGFITPFWQKGY